MLNPYEVLGISSSATMDEVEMAYMKLSADLGDMRFREGEEGRQAAEKLQAVKEAYEEIRYMRGNVAGTSYENGDYKPLGKVEELIQKGDLDSAQKILDSQIDRGAEWHYMQAALYYRKGWIMESKAQLELARQLNPNEPKYAKAYKNLTNVINFGNPDGPGGQAGQSQSGGNNPYRSYPQGQPSPDSSGDTCCKICGAIMCADCCCDCIGGGC